MPGFKIHITGSTVLGIGYGVGAYALYNVPWETCTVAGALCSVSGMLPDLDSDSGRPLQESLSFGAATVPMLLLERFRNLGWSPEQIVLAAAGIYLAIRFGFGAMLKKFTVHRGIFHSIPAAFLATLLAFLICASGSLDMRYFKAGGVLLGFMSHLILDEIWSVDLKRFRLKSSFGTAIKFWSDNALATATCYLLCALATLAVLQDPVWANGSPEGQQLHQMATEILDGAWRK